MQELILKSDQVLVPGRAEVGNFDVLRIYFRVFETGQGNILPPVLVVDSKYNGHVINVNDHEWDRRNSPDSRFYYERKLAERMSQLEMHGVNIYLLDGDHRAMAACLTGNDIRALKLESDHDLSEIRRRSREGEFFGFPRREETLSEIVRAFESHVCMRSDELVSVKDRVKKLVREKKLPRYMIKEFRFENGY